ncbi:dolichyl-phosphate beta-glucosyltransferase [Chloroflexota bacterium]
MMIGYSLSLVVPAYNEESRIEAVALNYASSFPEAEIIVVCNGCVDNTLSIASRLSDGHRNIRALNFKEKIGKGGAIIEGFKTAQGDIIGFVDADESTSPEDVARMLNAMTDKEDGVIASRKLKDSRILVKQPLLRRLASKAFNIMVRLMFGLKFRDTQCGAKVFRKEAIKTVLPQLKTGGFEFDIELLWKLKLRGYRIIEFPITWRHSEGSTFSLSHAPRMFCSLMRMRFSSQKPLKPDIT